MAADFLPFGPMPHRTPCHGEMVKLLSGRSATYDDARANNLYASTATFAPHFAPNHLFDKGVGQLPSTGW